MTFFYYGSHTLGICTAAEILWHCTVTGHRAQTNILHHIYPISSTRADPKDDTEALGPSPELPQPFQNLSPKPRVAFRTNKSLKQMLVRARVQDKYQYHKINRNLRALQGHLPLPNSPPLIAKCNKPNCCLPPSHHTRTLAHTHADNSTVRRVYVIVCLYYTSHARICHMHTHHAS